MASAYRPIAISAMILLSTSTAESETLVRPIKFFEGRTQSEGVLKVMLKKAYPSRSVGIGTVRPDGSLTLVQQVEELGKPARERRWHISEVAPGRYAGTMSEAVGKVTIDEVEGRYRVRLKMAGGVSAEQWLTLQPGGKSARSQLTVRKFGVTVATGQGTIRKVS